jgi:hypothetical protein
LKLPLESF